MGERHGRECLSEREMEREEVVSWSGKKEEFGVDSKSLSRKCSYEVD